MYRRACMKFFPLIYSLEFEVLLLVLLKQTEVSFISLGYYLVVGKVLHRQTCIYSSIPSLDWLEMAVINVLRGLGTLYNSTRETCYSSLLKRSLQGAI